MSGNAPAKTYIFFYLLRSEHFGSRVQMHSCIVHVTFAYQSLLDAFHC